MNNSGNLAESIKNGAISGLPIVVGYFPVAVAFGLLSKNTGVPFMETALFSIIVFAGASQFMALDLIKTGVSTGSIILATFLLNLRHLMMSASLSVKMGHIKKRWLLFIAFGVTDETFSVTALSNRKLLVPYLITLHGISHTSWVLGTVAGYLAGSVLPLSVQNSLGVGLYSMFAALLMPKIRISKSVLLISAVSAVIYAIIDLAGIIPSSWSLVAAILAASLIGSFFIKEIPEELNNEKGEASESEDKNKCGEVAE